MRHKRWLNVARVDLGRRAVSCEGTAPRAEKRRVQPRSSSPLMSLDLPEGGRTCKRERDTALRMSKMKERFLNRFRLTLKEFQRHFHVPHFTDEEKLRGSAHSLLHGFPYEAVTEMIITRPHLTRHNDPTTKWASDLSRLIRILPRTFLT